MKSIDQRFKDRDECYRALNDARKVFDAGSTKDQYRQVYKMLGMILLYCPADVSMSVEATMGELEMRFALVFDEVFTPIDEDSK